MNPVPPSRLTRCAVTAHVWPMVRTNIYLSEQQDRELKRLAEEGGLKKSELIRRAIDDYILKIKRQERSVEP